MKNFTIFVFDKALGNLNKISLIIFFLLIYNTIYTQDSVTDYDGNVYHTIQIGNQVWLQENMKCTHYSDGTEVPGVVAYNDDENMAEIYGRLYSWDAAMRNSIDEDAQGIAPDGWHIASDDEWTELENYLGGASVAGGKMKEVGSIHWQLPNTGADNSSGFTALPGGEYDAYYSPHKFQFLKSYAVFWTSTQVNTSKARERYLKYSSTSSSKYDWFKVMKYSIRCIKNSTTTVGKHDENTKQFKLGQNYPNPFNPTTTINYNIGRDSNVTLKIYDVLGTEVKELVNDFIVSGEYSVVWDGKNNYGKSVSSGLYFYILSSKNIVETRKMILMK